MIDLLRQRRSVRLYLDRGIEPEKQQILREALVRSPSSRNRQPWTFVWVEDQPTLQRLSRCKPHGAAFLAEAPLAVVICGDPAISDVWIEDCSIAAICLQMTAQSLGLGSCWVQIRRRPHDETCSAEQIVRRLLGLPDSLRVLAAVALGYPAEHKPPIEADALPWCRIRVFAGDPPAGA